MNDHIRNCYLYGGVSKDSNRIKEYQRRTIQSWIDARFENGWRHMGADQSR